MSKKNKEKSQSSGSSNESFVVLLDENEKSESADGKSKDKPGESFVVLLDEPESSKEKKTERPGNSFVVLLDDPEESLGGPVATVDKDDSGKIHVHLGEDISVSHIVELKETLLDTLTGDPVLIDGSEVLSVDTSTAQLLIAYRESMAEHETPLEWSGRSDRLNEVLALLGVADAV